MAPARRTWLLLAVLCLAGAARGSREGVFVGYKEVEGSAGGGGGGDSGDGQLHAGSADSGDAAAAAAVGRTILLHTQFGPIRVKLLEQLAPKTTALVWDLAQRRGCRNCAFYRCAPGRYAPGWHSGLARCCSPVDQPAFQACLFWDRVRNASAAALTFCLPCLAGFAPCTPGMRPSRGWERALLMRCCRGGWICQRQVQRCGPCADAHCRLRCGHPAWQAMLPACCPAGSSRLSACRPACLPARAPALLRGSPACPAPPSLP